MANWIEHVRDPRRLILAWQAPDHFNDRFRWAVGEISPSDKGFVFRYFNDGPEFLKLNNDRPWTQLIDLGYRGYPAFTRKVERHPENALAPFLRRIPPRRRPDFDSYKSFFKVPSHIDVSDLALLALTEAKLPSDGFSLVDPLEGDDGPRELALEVAGYRYYAKDAPFPDALGEPVQFVPEPTNLKDRNAVAVKVRNVLIGYINRLQAGAFLQWITEGRVSGTIDRLNGTAEKPRLYVFVRVAHGAKQNAA